MNEPVCKRQGHCCHFPDENGNRRKCKHLVKLPSGKTLCRIYKKRLGQLLYKKGDYEVRCHMRTDVHKNYPNCPFNKEEYEDDME